jgi:hypothetical protein
MSNYYSNEASLIFAVGVPRINKNKWSEWGTSTPYERFRNDLNYFQIYVINTENDNAARAADAASAGTEYSRTYSNGCPEVFSIDIPIDHL